LPDRLPLLDKGGHAFLSIFGSEGRVEQSLLSGEALGQRRLEGCICCLLAYLEMKNEKNS
jgi:hypothetical protein